MSSGEPIEGKQEGGPPVLLPNGVSSAFFLDFNDSDILNDNMFRDPCC